MRLKSSEGNLQALHNRNNDILNSPKRINTVQNSNYNNQHNLENLTNLNRNHHVTTNDIINIQQFAIIEKVAALNNIHQDTTELQWCNSNTIINSDQQQININRLNINNSLKNTQLRLKAQQQTEQLMPQSPDDVLIDHDVLIHSCCSSIQASPQDEDQHFDASDSAESSDEGNNDYSNDTRKAPLKGFINPNYPGFQHLAHTLDFDDVDDDDERLNTANNNNNNNNNEIFEVSDPIDSANRLDSVENIQKVFQDKSLDLEVEADYSENNQIQNSTISDSSSSSINCDSGSECGATTSDSITDSTIIIDNFNIQIDEKKFVVRISKNDTKENKEKVSPEVSSINSGKGFQASVEFAIKNCDEKPSSTYVENPKQVAEIQENDSKISLQEVSAKKDSDLSLADDHFKQDETLLNIDDTTIPLTRKMGKKVPTFLPLNKKFIFTPSSSSEVVLSPIGNKMIDADLSVCSDNIKLLTAKKKIHQTIDLAQKDSSSKLEEMEYQFKKIKTDTINNMSQRNENFKDEFFKSFNTPTKVSAVKKRSRDYNQQFGSLISFPKKRELPKRDPLNRRSVPLIRERIKNEECLESFDVFNIETAMPKIDLEAIENHLKAAKEEERRRQTDREEIRRRLAMGSEDEYYSERPGRKPSLQSRLQSGMNLQICFMNETVSDNESPSSDNECPLTNPKASKTLRQTCNQNYRNSTDNNKFQQSANTQRPATLALHPAPLLQLANNATESETDFFAKQARLQTEARMALAQAKEMARMQMEIEKQKQKKSPITEMVRHSLEKIGIPFPEDKRRLSRQILTEMNVAQLQVIVNDLHTQIESLNEKLVQFLMNRDDLHMEQDSMLVDIEDLTRYLGAKEQVLKEQNQVPTPQNNNLSAPNRLLAPSSPLISLNNTVRPHLNRIANLVKK